MRELLVFNMRLRLSLFFHISVSVWLHSAAEEHRVTCVYGHSCVLPGSLNFGDDLIISWAKIEGALIVHEYYKGQSQLQQQHEDYRGRTALYEDEITKGNASLLLREVRVQDEGTYECLTGNGAVRITVVRLRVTAPVVGLSLEQSRGRLLCGAEGIYPRPAVTWTFSPGPPDTPQTTVTSSSETGLFSVSSSVPLTLSSPPHEYTCSVSTEHSWRSATYRTNPESTEHNLHFKIPGWMVVALFLIAVIIIVIICVIVIRCTKNKARSTVWM